MIHSLSSHPLIAPVLFNSRPMHRHLWLFRPICNWETVSTLDVFHPVWSGRPSQYHVGNFDGPEVSHSLRPTPYSQLVSGRLIRFSDRIYAMYGRNRVLLTVLLLSLTTQAGIGLWIWSTPGATCKSAESSFVI
jgi:hypothetical protein